MDHNEQFYKRLFTQKVKWSSPQPNKDESTRWKIIERFLYYVKGYKAAQQQNQMQILDLGCGRGWLTNLLSAHGTVMGIEPVKPVVDYANTIFPELNISWGTSNTLLANFPDKKFDLIVSSEVIEHVEDAHKNEFVSNIGKLLKHNGFCIITTPRKEVESAFLKYSKPNQPVENWITEDSLKNLFVENEFNPLLKERIAYRPWNRYHPFAPIMEIYQLWLFKKNSI